LDGCQSVPGLSFTTALGTREEEFDLSGTGVAAAFGFVFFGLNVVDEGVDVEGFLPSGREALVGLAAQSALSRAPPTTSVSH